MSKIPSKRASDLKPGDLIAAEFLLYVAKPAQVIFVYPYQANGEEFVYVAYLTDDGVPDSNVFTPRGLVQVAPASTDTTGGA